MVALARGKKEGDAVELTPVVDERMAERFETDGAVALRGLLDATWIDALRDSAGELLDGGYDPTARMKTRGSRSQSSIVQSSGKWRESETFRRFLSESPIAAVSAALMRSSTARLYEDLFQVRQPSQGTAWHRDMPYWPVSGHQATNVWFNLEPVTPYAGGLHVVAGTHTDRREDFSAPDEPSSSHQVLAFGAEPGDVIIFHPWALHSGYGAMPDQPRRTFTIRFLGDDIRWRPTPSYYHGWMADTGLREGDALDHPGFPLLRPPAMAAIGSQD
jgi:ectoine hydroxylase-related dioxygenase (phytanoyl-CoA dioxygenase family)